MTEDHPGPAPDPWALHGEDAAAHLEAHHQDELRELARGGGYRAAAVAVSSLRPEGMVLTCLGRDGVADVVIPFDPPVPDPAALGRWLRRHTGHRAP